MLLGYTGLAEHLDRRQGDVMHLRRHGEKLANRLHRGLSDVIGLEADTMSTQAGNSGMCRRRVRVEQGIYRQPNGKYAVCFMLDGRPTFRTVGYELDATRRERRAFVEAARWGVVASAPQLRFGQVAGWWIERFERRVAAGERCERTLEFRRYHLEHHLMPVLGGRLLREITVHDVAELLASLREQGRAENTIAGILATLQCVLRFAARNG